MIAENGRTKSNPQKNLANAIKCNWLFNFWQSFNWSAFGQFKINCLNWFCLEIHFSSIRRLSVVWLWEIIHLRLMNNRTTNFFIIVQCTQSSTCQCLEMTIFCYITVMFLSWDWEKIQSVAQLTFKKIVKSMLRRQKTINSLKNYFQTKWLCKEWFAHVIACTGCADDNNNTHLFSLISVNKQKSFLWNLYTL